MAPIMIAAWMIQVAIPLLIAALIAFGPARNRTHWWTQVGLAVTLLATLRLVTPWLAIPRSVLGLETALLAFALAVPRVRGKVFSPAAPSAGSKVLLGVELAALATLGFVVVRSLEGRRLPDPEGRGVQVVDLAFPFEEGRYLVASGGSTPMVNAHLRTLGSDPRFTPWRGQSHAVDLVRLGRWGSHRAGLFAGRPEDYAIFDQPVVAPCSGRVLQTENDAPEQPIGERDLEARSGNHVIIECEGVWVVLAHLRQGSLAVSPGVTVSAGEPLGRIGNSGATDQPHLHIHAQLPGTEAAPLSGEPIPILFDGRYPVRNQVVRR